MGKGRLDMKMILIMNSLARHNIKILVLITGGGGFSVNLSILPVVNLICCDSSFHSYTPIAVVCYAH